MPDVTMAEIGARIRARRILMRLTTEEASAQVPVNHSTYRSWENGDNKIAAVDLAKVARVLHVSSSYLVGEETDAMAEESARLVLIRQLPPALRRMADRLLAVLVEEARRSESEKRE